VQQTGCIDETSIPKAFGTPVLIHEAVDAKDDRSPDSYYC